MTNQSKQNLEIDESQISDTMADIAERSQRLVQEFLNKQAQPGTKSVGIDDPLNIGSAFLEMTTKMMTQPHKMVEANMNLWQDYMKLWQNAASRMMGQETTPIVEPERDDRRFKGEAWENDVFDFIKQSYLLTSNWMENTVSDIEGLDKKTKQKVEFFTKQYADALSPTNFVMTNPEVLQTTIESRGENLVNGLRNLLEDMERGGGKLSIKMTDADAFEVGKNVATTPGKVVFRNDLMELIQYTPTTEKVSATPLLICPPWINKFYILDLREKNSFIKWAVEQGNTVFVISWVNPDRELAMKTFADYMLEGPLAAIKAIQDATGADEINAVGYCIGGTLLATTLAYMAAKKLKGVKSATFFTTMVDFEEAGDLGVFIDDTSLKNLEDKMNERGYLEGSEMASTFNMMKANDLVWSFVVNNYLLGKDPFPFDLLFWNSDSTRMPAAMHSFYLRNMYLDNKLVEPGGIEIEGVKLDLTKIKVPTYIISTREDHIAPWKPTYKATQLYSGPIRFILSASGHIAGVVNPPAAGKYCYWINDETPADPDEWLAGAEQHEGSWWPDWDKWIKKQNGKELVDARQPGDGKLKVLCDAPGTYVNMKAES
ncbi:MAG: class I poly(R)-hydroxyalkanoic acid synthase [Rhodospirillales bacterium]|nr:class I poly(R)-hydroxyalkanoic acid synthase [Rhodospirillales bacterium]MBO6786582.1 class I poly(R)-hydroxyalkanoic acid synthase [Rhodospirillales bacterium]